MLKNNLRERSDFIKKFIKVITITILILLSIALVYTYKGYKMYKNALNEKNLEDKIKEIKSIENYQKIEELPKIYLDAVISIEDHRFYNHSGIDIISIGRALIHDIKEFEFVEGGSTITQQLAKNMYFTQEKKIERKIAETFLALKLEKTLKKEEILELYLNTSYFGEGYYGIKEACMGYFGKEPKDMTDDEAILLAGLPNAPSIYGANKKLAKQRQKQVLNKMIEYNKITKKEAKKILESDENE